MEIVAVDLDNQAQKKQYLSLPYQIYARTPQWVPPLPFEADKAFKTEKFAFYSHGEAQFFLALSTGGAPVGRISVLVNHRYNAHNNEKTAFFYQLEGIDDPDVFISLLEAAENWARARDLNRLIGPKGFSVMDGFGLLIEGFHHRPAFGQPYNQPYYQTYIEKAGYEPVRELLTGYMDERSDFPAGIHTLADRIRERRGLTIAQYHTRSDLRRLIPRLKDLYNSTLTGTSGNAPLTDQEVKSLSDQLLWFADPSLIKVVMKDEQPVGFLFAYPDISAALQRNQGKLLPFGWADLLIELKTTRWINLNGAGMIEGYRGSGGTAVLFSELFKSVQNSRYRYADIVQIGTENEKMLREMKRFGIDFYKRHRLYARDL